MTDTQPTLRLLAERAREAAPTLRELALKATPGPWVVWSSLYDHMDAQLRSADTTVEGVALAEFYRLANGYQNAAFIAAANPTRILADQDRIETLERENARLREGGFSGKDGAQWVRKDDRDAARDEAQSLTAQNAALVEEVGRLRAALIEERAHAIYNGWSFQPDWVTWVAGGNGHKQNEARALASQALNGEPK